MNFIDRALAQGDVLTDDDLLQAMADIYEEPQVWQELDRCPRYIRDIIYIIDYDTELQMEGLDACAGSARWEQYVQALERCGAVSEAEILRQARALADSGPDYEDETVSAGFEALSLRTALRQDYEGFWELVRAYIGRERS